jgi:photosystem II stability/assembly factor-like uncharacterized protein/tetratricopeptide (TPR) repeat protein
MGADTYQPDFFVAGGTLHPDSPSYVKRAADDELLGLVLSGELSYVLTSRQMGKSSLMVRTHRRLREQGMATAILDLTEIGLAEAEQWYLVIISLLADQLRLSVDPVAWWGERAALSVVQRFVRFLHDVVLAEIEGPVVIFVDEIDAISRLGFSDDFFAALRYTHNACVTDPTYCRLSFVLLGSATPADLIKDSARTPFNVGSQINLSEFGRADAEVLKKGLELACPGRGDVMLDRIFYWTAGHPYLTQRLCLATTQTGVWSEGRIDSLVEKLFLSEEARQESNLQFVRRSIQDSPERRRLLFLYRKVHQGKRVAEDERSLDQNRLKLIGLVRGENGVLSVRNEIYRRVFNAAWIRANLPVDWARRIAVVSVALVLLLAGMLGLVIYRQGQQTLVVQAQTHIDNFSIQDPEVRITSLAGLFQLPGYADAARYLFFEKLSPADQRGLFYTANPQEVSEQLVIVVRGVYTHLGHDAQATALLAAMAQSLRRLDGPSAQNLAAEIEQWLQGRAHQGRGEYRQAVQAYALAIGANDQNPGAYLDRALAYAALDEPGRALADLALVLTLDPGRQEQVQQVLSSNAQLYAALWDERNGYSGLVALVPSPTSTPTPPPTRTPTPPPLPPPSPSPTYTQAPPTATPFPKPTPTLIPSLWTVTGPLLIDSAAGRMYAAGLLEGSPRTLVLSTQDGGLVVSYENSGRLGLDEVHQRLYVDGADQGLAVLDAPTGRVAAVVALPGSHMPGEEGPAPLADPAQDQVLAFRDNVMYVVDPQVGEVKSTIPFEITRDRDCRTGDEPLSIARAWYDAGQRLLYLDFVTYVCTPWVGHTLVSYDMAAGREVARQGLDPFAATASDGYLYGASWHRFGIGSRWAWRAGRPWIESTDWGGAVAGSQIDTRRQRLYEAAAGTLYVFDAQTMSLMMSIPQPADGQLAGYDPQTEQLYFVSEGRLAVWPISALHAPRPEPWLSWQPPAQPVHALLVSPTWSQDRTLVGIWGHEILSDDCYAFGQMGGTLAISLDGGESWGRPVGGLQGGCDQVSAVAVSPAYGDDQTLLAGVVGTGIYQSIDGGRLWQPASRGLAGMGIEQILMSPGYARDATVFARPRTGGLHRSTDGGRSWQALGVMLNPLAMSPDYTQDHTLLGMAYIAEEERREMRLSRDGGEHWERAGDVPQGVTFSMVSLAPLFERWGVAFAYGDNGVLYRSEDWGETWQEVLHTDPAAANRGASSWEPPHLLYAPDVEVNRPVFLLTIAAEGSEPGALRGALYRSGDGGQTWQAAQLPEGVDPTALAISPDFSRDGLLFLGTADGRVLMMDVRAFLKSAGR